MCAINILNCTERVNFLGKYILEKKWWENSSPAYFCLRHEINLKGNPH